MDSCRIDSRPAFLDDQLTHQIIGAAIEVHSLLGPGLLEGAYEDCLCAELMERKLPFQRQLVLPLEYKSLRMIRAYRLDLVIGDAVVVELKAIDKVLPVHDAQMRTYLKLSGFDRGLLLNFNSVPLKNGIRRYTRAGTLTVSPSPTPSNPPNPDGDTADHE